jgi:hypothetical protein
MQMNNQLSMQQAAMLVNSREDYHYACVKNGFRMPAVKSPICSIIFMKEIRAGVTWVPKLAEVKLAPCPNPPSIEDIRNELVQLIETNLNTVDQSLKEPLRSLMNHLKCRPADKAFMLDIISTVTDRNHRYFAKDYLPPKKHTAIKDQLYVDNQDNFFTGLPEAKRTKSKRM